MRSLNNELWVYDGIIQYPYNTFAIGIPAYSILVVTEW